MNSGRIFRLGDDFELHQALGCLRTTSGHEVHLRPKSFQTLLFLIERRDRLVTKEELAAHLWRDTAVTDDALVRCIVELRRALGDSAREPRYVRTLPKVGYRFVGPVVETVSSDVAEGARGAMVSAPETIEENGNGPRGASESAPGDVLAGPTTSAAPSGPQPEGWRWRGPLAAAVILLLLAGAYVTRRGDARALDERQPPPTLGADRTAVAVMFLDNQSQNAELDWLREGLADMLITGLSRSKAVSALSRDQLDIWLDRVHHEDGRAVSLDEALDVGRRARAQYVLLGSFATLGATIRIDLRLHDTEGRLTAAESLTVDKAEALLTEVDLLSWKLARHLSGGTETPRVAAAQVFTNNLDAYRYYSLGVSKANAYHSADAIELFERALELDPQFAMARARIGYVHGVTWGLHLETARTQLELAYQTSTKLGERERLQIEAWRALANLDYAAAIEPLQRLMVLHPNESESYERLGQILNGDRRHDEALAVYQRGLSANPEAGVLFKGLGATYFAQGRIEDALAAHQRYVDIEPREPNSHDTLGLSLHTVGRYEEAIASFERALDLEPEFEPAIVHLGNTHLQMGHYRAAMDAYLRYIAVAPSAAERARGHASLAFVHHRLGNRAEALRHGRIADATVKGSAVAVLTVLDIEAGGDAERLMASIPEMSRTYSNRGARLTEREALCVRGGLMLETNQTDQALASMRHALTELAPVWHWDSYEDCVASGLLRAGRADEALAEFSRVLRLNPRYPLAHFKMARAYEAKGDLRAARAAYQEFLRVWRDADPNVPEVREARARLAQPATAVNEASDGGRP